GADWGLRLANENMDLRPSIGCLLKAGGTFGRERGASRPAAGRWEGRRHECYVFHNTRHTAVTNLVNGGTPTHEAMLVSGHTTRSIFDRYPIGSEDETRAALCRQTAKSPPIRVGAGERRLREALQGQRPLRQAGRQGRRLGGRRSLQLRRHLSAQFHA